MAIIKKYSSFQNLGNYKTFIQDTDPNSEFFRITEFKETFTGGKNGFLIEGTPHLKETTEIKIEILDVEGNTVYFEPGSGIPEYYEGNSILVAVHVYDDTPIGIAQITILGEAKTYETDAGLQDIPDEWKGLYNVKWQKKFKINKLLSNEDKVRFYKRPLVSIDEIAKSIFSVTTPTVTQSGSLVGIPNLPAENTNLSNWTAGTNYKLKIVDDTTWTSSISENVISISGLSSSYEPRVLEVLNNKELLVDVPYTVGGMVKSFGSSSYVSTFEHLDGQTLTNSSLTGSFAKIDISRLKTFVGDVARVKIFRKSRNDVGDYVLTQDTKLESTELLRDLTVENKTQISYGFLTEYNLLNYWVTSSADHPVSINVDKLLNSMFIDYNTGVGGVQKIETLNYIPISSDVEYTLDFKTRFVGAVSSSKSIRAYLSSSTYTQDFTDFNSSNSLKSVTSISNNILATTSSLAKLVFEVEGDDWYISNISLRNAQDTSFSPDEFTLIQSIPRNLEVETFDFRFEFYDINNNYIPVRVVASKEFNGGNLSTVASASGSNGADGLDASTVYLTQPVHVFNVPSSSGYVGIDYSSSISEIRFYNGINKYTYEGGAGPWSPNTYRERIISAVNCTYTTGITGSDWYMLIDNITADYGYIRNEVVDNNNSLSYPFIYSWGVTRSGDSGTSGSNGTNAKTNKLIADSYVITYDATGSESPTGSITLTGTAINHEGTVYYDFLKDSISQQNTTTNTYVIPEIDEPGPGTSSLWSLQTRENSDSASVIATDTISIYGIQTGTNGEDAFTVILTNEAHTLPSDNTGSIDYTGSGTRIYVYEGSTQLIANETSGNGEFWVSASLQTNIDVGTITDGGDYVLVGEHSNMTQDTAQIEYTITGYRATSGTPFSFIKYQSFGKTVSGTTGSAGTDGLKSISGYVYYQSASDTPPDPNPPSATSYTFSTFEFTGLTTDWAKTPPIATAGGKYWVSVFNVSESSPGTDTGVPTFTSASNSLLFTDIVTFIDLQTSGSTVINGDNITTGILRSANFIPISGSDYSFTGTEIDMTEGAITSPTFYIDGLGAGGLGGWSFSDGEIFKDEIRINSNRPAIEIYDTTGELRVDINSSETLTPYSSSATFTPSATTITTGVATYGPQASTPIGGYVQSTMNGTLTGSVGVTFEVTSAELGKTATIGADMYQDVGTPYHEWGVVSGALSFGNAHWTGGFRVYRPDGTYVPALYYFNKETVVGGTAYQSGSLLTTMDLDQLGTYTILPFVSTANFGGLSIGVTSVTITTRTPKLGNITIDASINKTEIIAGGFQVVKDAGNFFRIDRNANTSGGAPFITSEGKWSHNGVIITTSDIKQKSNINPITFDLKELKNINGYTYDLNVIPFKDKDKYTQEEYDKFKYKAAGIIADEIEAILPDSVTVAEDSGVKFVDYQAVTALILNIVKQLYEEIEKLKPPTP